MATLSVQLVNRPGLLPTYETAQAGGDEFANTETEFLLLKNDGGSAINATVVVTQTIDGGAVSADPLAVTQVPSSQQVIVGPFPRITYGDTVNISYDSVVNLGVALLRLVP